MPATLIAEGHFQLTAHAAARMAERHLSQDALEAVLDFGRIVYTRGAAIHALGRREISRRPWLAPFHGVQVVCSDDGAVVTVYRNRDFRSLRPRRRTSRTRQAWGAAGK